MRDFAEVGEIIGNRILSRVKTYFFKVNGALWRSNCHSWDLLGLMKATFGAHVLAFMVPSTTLERDWVTQGAPSEDLERSRSDLEEWRERSAAEAKLSGVGEASPPSSAKDF